MTVPESDSNDRQAPTISGHLLRDRRVRPQGALPRQLQTWLMVGVAGIILLIILVTGHAQPPAQTARPDRTPSATPAPPERIRGFERQLSDDEARLRELAGRASAGEPQASAPAPVPSTRLADDPRHTVDAGLSADNVAFSRRSNTSSAVPHGQSAPAAGDPAAQALSSEMAALDPWLRALAQVIPPPPNAVAAPTQVPVQASPPAPAAVAVSHEASDNVDNSQSNRERVLEGTVIEAVLLNRLDGTYTGPVTALVTSPVYAHDRQHVIIPAGAKILGSSAAVQSWGESRLAVVFHRLVMPDGRTYSLDLFKGLSQVGETGLRDQVNRHYGQVFGASLAIGALSGLAQLQTRTGLNMSFADTAGQGAGSSLATSATRILDRYLNVLPTVTIREGYRLKVYITSDLALPPYRPVFGGAQ